MPMPKTHPGGSKHLLPQIRPARMEKKKEQNKMLVTDFSYANKVSRD